jgi:hypothetical protein
MPVARARGDAAPMGWPVYEPGLMMAVVDRVLLIRLDRGLTQASFDRYRTEWLRSIDSRSHNARIGALYTIPTWAGVTASMRKQWAEMLKSREDVLRRTTAGMALVTPSPLVRGALSAIFWLAPPPYPTSLVDSPTKGIAFLASKLPGLDVEAVERQYHALTHRYEQTV